MTDKSPTPPDRPDPHLDPSDDTDEPAFDWMKPASAGKPTAGSPAGSAAAAGPAAGTAAAGTAAPSDATTASQPESRADRKAAEAAATGQTNAAQPDAVPSDSLPDDDERGAGAGASAGARPDSAAEDEVERRNAERRTAEREQAAKAKPVLPRVLQVLLAVFYPVILLVLAVRAVTSPLFLWVEYNRPGFPGDGYGFSTDDRMTYGSYAVDYLSNWSGPRYLGDLVDQSGERLFKDGEVSHMADVKAVILSTFGAGTLLILLGLAAVIYLKRRHSGGVRRSLFAGSLVTLALIIGLGTLAVLGWEQFFTDFHRIFFANGTWTFTLQDTLIRLFPGQFWMDAGIAIGSLVLLASLVTLVLTWPTRRRRGLGKKAAGTAKGTDPDAGAGTEATAEAAPAADGTAGSDAEGGARTRHTV
ncbi:TIGR01906 family membrane protein [Arthrobacter sp. 131MFCol6.1]|uniref:TIGR01906 family membrane protein n=1 Tax=Arthrobacter sp. 131MFCol6.1 TaxID=1157944 RepID=UPI0003602E49|nr:TIGR01906 family membrane protein [Arthrobacter sp. 131MFCol6.1]